MLYHISVDIPSAMTTKFPGEYIVWIVMDQFPGP